MSSAGSPSARLSALLETKHVLITVGAGGVGKTTTAAALAVILNRRRLLRIDEFRREPNLLAEVDDGFQRLVRRILLIATILMFLLNFLFITFHR